MTSYCHKIDDIQTYNRYKHLRYRKSIWIIQSAMQETKWNTTKMWHISIFVKIISYSFCWKLLPLDTAISKPKNSKTVSAASSIVFCIYWLLLLLLLMRILDQEFTQYFTNNSWLLCKWCMSCVFYYFKTSISNWFCKWVWVFKWY